MLLIQLYCVPMPNRPDVTGHDHEETPIGHGRYKWVTGKEVD